MSDLSLTKVSREAAHGGVPTVEGAPQPSTESVVVGMPHAAR